jgi:nucleoside-diphosphate-sugar epimerase
MTEERFLITGALGCIGAWTTRRLLDEGVPVVTFDLPGNPHRLRLLLSEEELAGVTRIDGDVTDTAGVARAVADHGITHIIHLAALQVPFVRADPPKGMHVNVVGTTNVFEAAKAAGDQVKGTAYASSIAVYGSIDRYPPGPLAHDAALLPETLYGVTKQANEWTASVYWRDYGLRTIGLRPAFVYGLGRDQGVSSVPTKAMLAGAIGRPYAINIGGAATFQHADDVAKAFIQAVRAGVDGAPVFNLGGTSASMADVVAAIEAAVPEAAGTITFEQSTIPVPAEIDGSAAEAAIGEIGWRPFPDGVRQTIDDFRAAIAAGRLDVERAIG